MWLRLTFSLLLFVGSLAVGWALHRAGKCSETTAARLVRWIVMVPSPLVLCLAFWRMNLRSLEPWLLPFLGLLISGSTLLPAYAFIRRAQLTRPQAGGFLTCAFFSNLGYLGAFTAFALYGEAGYVLCMLYLLFFTPSFYTWGFWIGVRYGKQLGHSPMRAGFNDQLRLFPFFGMLMGVVLNVAGVPRPLPLEWLNGVLIPMDTALYLIAVGSQLTFESPRPWLRPCLSMSAIKFLYTPCVAWVLLSALQIEGLPRTIVLLESATPVAVSPLVLPLIFGLDRRFTNALWLFTSVLAIPVFLLLIPLLPHL